MWRRVAVVLLFSSLAAAQAADQQPKFFKITPVRPVTELREEALKAKPPVEVGDFRKPDLVELVKLDPTIKLDIRYATSNDFLGTPVYEEARAFMERPAAEAVVRANQKLHKLGYGLLIHDAYRPWYVTKIFWDATPPDKHDFVADPAKGSQHNRGCAVDLTMYDMKTGKAVPMPGLYDEMSERSYPSYKGGTEEERANRELLRKTMESEGFTVYEYEWWHFDYKDWKKYPILNVKFADIPAQKKTAEIGTQGLENSGPDLTGYTGPNGIVKIFAIVDTRGKLHDCRVAKSLDADADKRALAAVRKWTVSPATKDGRPVMVQSYFEVPIQHQQ